MHIWEKLFGKDSKDSNVFLSYFALSILFPSSQEKDCHPCQPTTSILTDFKPFFLVFSEKLKRSQKLKERQDIWQGHRGANIILQKAAKY